jgi:multidrug efflux pump subunit AcrA (membrane-fusion protein)
MTANVDFKLAHRTNVIAVPSQAIITKDNNPYVVIDNGNGTTTDQQVTTGIEGDNGYVEITSGLNAGDHIITFTNQ